MTDFTGMPDRRQAFLEEARDLLVALESGLLELENDARDPEIIGSVFRALHTIKGSGSMFGFDEVAAFTHHVETAYDLVRSGQLAVSPRLISLTLEARDHIQHLLEATVGQQPMDQAAGNAILASLEKVARPGTPAEEVPATGAQHHYSLRFTPPPDLFRRGSNLLPLFDELRALGELRIEADLSQLPTLDGLELDHCYLNWCMELTSTCDAEAIRDVFLFVDDGNALTIEEHSARQATGAQEPASDTAVDSADDSGTPSSAASRPVTSSLRVSAAKLDELINIVGELVTIQARLSGFAHQSGDIEIAHIAEETERLTSMLRDNTMSIRMLPIEATFSRYRRLVRDLATDLGKEVELVTEGGDTELDKSVIDQIADPLVHLIRNSVDHGLETPEKRLAAGKPQCGRLLLSASHSGSQVHIRVSDDGAGLDAARIRARAIEKGLIDPHAELTESEIHTLIFRTGFSTAQTVSSVSGRGVGMDVVKQNVDNLRGSIELNSEPGKGTTFTLKLPLTLAIIDGLLVRVAEQHFVFPVVQIVECLEMAAADLHHGRREFIEVRGKLVPLIFLDRYFRLRAGPRERAQIMVGQTSAGDFGFVVDAVIGDHKTVIKQLGPLYRQVEAVSGATILGDGTIALILDADKMAHSAIAEVASSAA